MIRDRAARLCSQFCRFQDSLIIQDFPFQDLFGRLCPYRCGSHRSQGDTCFADSVVFIYFEEDGNAKPYSVTDMDFLPRCPYCANELDSEDAVVCLHCGYNTTTRIRQEPKKTYETTGGEMFLWLLPGILCAIGVLLCVTQLVLFWALFPKLEEDNKDVWWGSFFALWARIWGSVIVLFITFFLAKFAIKRLILNNKPPEVEKKK